MASPAPDFRALLISAMRKEMRKAERGMRSDDDPEAVHLLRTGIKRMRATWKTLRDEIPTAKYAGEIAMLRKPARALARLRDAYTIRRTFEKLQARLPENVSSVKILASVAEHRPAKRLLQDASSILEGSLQRFEALDGSLFANGRRSFLARSYRKARKAGRRLRESDEAGFHLLRKRVKEHGYQLEALRSCLPQAALKMLAGLDELQDALGEDHDLAMLAEFLERPSRNLAEEEKRRMGKAIAKRMRKLRKKSAAINRRIFRRKPARYLRALGIPAAEIRASKAFKRPSPSSFPA